MNTTAAPLTQVDRFVLEMAREVTAEHEADGCCTPAAPCEIVEYHQAQIAKLDRGFRETAPVVESEHAGYRPVAGARAANQYGVSQVKYATKPQLAYVGSLLRRRDRSNVTGRNAEVVAKAEAAFNAGQISKRLASDALDILTTLPELASAASAPKERRANRFGAKCIRCSGWVEAEAGFLAKDSNEKWAAEHKGECPAVAAAPAAQAELTKDDAGVYRTAGGDLYRVYLGQQSGRMLAKKIVGSVEDGFSFEYAGLAERFVTGAAKFTLAEAKEWGKATGTCCVCARRLDVPESVDAGIGPVCAGRLA